MLPAAGLHRLSSGSCEARLGPRPCQHGVARALSRCSASPGSPCLHAAAGSSGCACVGPAPAQQRRGGWRLGGGSAGGLRGAPGALHGRRPQGRRGGGPCQSRVAGMHCGLHCRRGKCSPLRLQTSDCTFCLPIPWTWMVTCPAAQQAHVPRPARIYMIVGRPHLGRPVLPRG